MQISRHALKRLKERFEFTDKEQVNNILISFFHKDHYKEIKINENGTHIRQITHRKKKIQGIVDIKSKSLISVIPDTFIKVDNDE